MPTPEVPCKSSLAGTEATGTGNVNVRLNGAITLGTLDEANVEIADAARNENEIIFGMLTPEVNALKGMGYHPNAFISGDNTAMAVLDFLEKGWNGENFSEVTSTTPWRLASSPPTTAGIVRRSTVLPPCSALSADQDKNAELTSTWK